MERSMVARAFWTFRQIFERVLELIVVALMVVLAVLVIVAVFLRYGGAPIHFYDEVASMLLAWLTYYGSALAAYRGAHIGFPGILNRVGPTLRVPLVIFAQAFVIGFFVLLAWVGWTVMEFMEGDALISLRWFPLQLAQHVIPVGAVLFIIAELLRTPELVRYATSDQQLVDMH
jgi:C4-dicarboxylate transporter DctQ subunit